MYTAFLTTVYYLKYAERSAKCY